MLWRTRLLSISANHLVLGLAVGLMAASPVYATCDPGSPIDLVTTDEEKQPLTPQEKQQRELEQNIERLTRTMQQSGKTSALLVARAELEHLAGRLEKAEADFSAAIEVDPKDAQLYLDRARFFQQQHRTDLAEADLSKAIEIAPTAPHYYARGVFYMDQWDTKKAHADFTSAIRVDRKYAPALAKRGLLQMRVEQGDDRFFGQPAADLQKAVELDPTLIDARRDLVLCVFKSKQYDEVIAHANVILEVYPDDECTRLYRAQAYRITEQTELALADANFLIEAHPGDSRFLRERARIYQKRKDFDNAAADFIAGTELQPESYLGYAHLGRFLTDIEKFQEAADAYTKAIELNTYHQGNQATFYKRRGVAYYYLDQWDQAAEDLAKAVELTPEDAHLRDDLGHMYVHMKRYDDAIEQFTELARLKPRWSSGFHGRAIVWMRLDEREKAIADASAPIEWGSDHYRDYEFRADIWKGLGEEEKAAADLKKAQELFEALPDWLQEKLKESAAQEAAKKAEREAKRKAEREAKNEAE